MTNAYIYFSIAEQCGADVICLNCHEARSLAAGTTNLSKIKRYFDKVIERKYFSSKGESLANDKRKYAAQYNMSPPPYETTNRNNPDSVM